MAIPIVAARGATYGFPGVDIDGTDLESLTLAFGAAVKRARARGGPTLVNAECVRLTAHTSDDQDTVYRPPEDIADAKETDPLICVCDALLERGRWNDEKERKLTAALKAEVDAALARAEAAPGARAGHDVPIRLRRAGGGGRVIRWTR